MVDIDRLTEEELRDLNHKIVERLRLIQQMRTHKRMMDFSVGERVSFDTDIRHIEGILAKYNRKTVTVVTEDGHSWNVSPSLLQKVQSPAISNRDNVIDITAGQVRRS